MEGDGRVPVEPGIPKDCFGGQWRGMGGLCGSRVVRRHRSTSMTDDEPAGFFTELHIWMGLTLPPSAFVLVGFGWLATLLGLPRGVGLAAGGVVILVVIGVVVRRRRGRRVGYRVATRVFRFVSVHRHAVVDGRYAGDGWVRGSVTTSVCSAAGAPSPPGPFPKPKRSGSVC
jgi:hypothetical protein